jgi:hypothetical protein
MKLTIIKDDGVVGINGVFKQIDLSTLPLGIRAVQWDGTVGHLEYYDPSAPNTSISDISAYQSFIDMWNLPPPVPIVPASTPASTHARISAAYTAAIAAMTVGYPASEISSWDKQEAEARAWTANNSTPTPWLDAAVAARVIAKADFVSRIISNADVFITNSGTLTGKRQRLRDQIDALGPSPTGPQLDAIQW